MYYMGIGFKICINIGGYESDFLFWIAPVTGWMSVSCGMWDNNNDREYGFDKGYSWL